MQQLQHVKRILNMQSVWERVEAGAKEWQSIEAMHRRSTTLHERKTMSATPACVLHCVVLLGLVWLQYACSLEGLVLSIVVHTQHAYGLAVAHYTQSAAVMLSDKRALQRTVCLREGLTSCHRKQQ